MFYTDVITVFASEVHLYCKACSYVFSFVIGALLSDDDDDDDASVRHQSCRCHLIVQRLDRATKLSVKHRRFS